MTPTEEAVKNAAEKLYRAGCGHVMEVSEMESIILSELASLPSERDAALEEAAQIEKRRRLLKGCL